MYGMNPIPNYADTPEGTRNIEDVEFPYSYARMEGTGYPLYIQGEFRDLSAEDQAFWAGWAAGFISITGSTLAFGTAIGAEGGMISGMLLSGTQLLAGTTVGMFLVAGTVVTAGAVIAGAIAVETSRLHHVANPERSSDPEFLAVLMGMGSWGSVV